MALTQTQLDEAMKPVQFDSHSSVDPTNSVSEPSLPSSSLLSKDKSFSSAVSPINSLLSGEKFQFGAVTSPSILPSNSLAVSHGIGPPGPCRLDIHISHNLSAAENDRSLFFEKENHSNESFSHLEDCEAEAAASAVAVAAISSDGVSTAPPAW
ncbi:STRESS RESPONSE PROTEIN NST1-RELATED [Salix viminalis]|uniref:STRESS RESPONSE PROTEIN NST1-RELATED n=1 Tax=Salix viminalis TaxID=40686 RepID=A0A9Q0NYT5_SALVM|nr:STRESS RESPONSE PROTEIN NST1-RELATED [Salix viminalis]